LSENSIFLHSANSLNCSQSLKIAFNVLCFY